MSFAPITGGSPRTSSPFGFDSSSSRFSASITPDIDDERSIYTSPTPVSRSLKADNVKEIYFKAHVEEMLEVNRKELEEGEDSVINVLGVLSVISFFHFFSCFPPFYQSYGFFGEVSAFYSIILSYLSIASCEHFYFNFFYF
ncbi:unnamed protein product [Haemonchus placei]|uniref:Nuclear pore complex protein NUP1 n=1 Tax=Haemonchus placei TaxID=6290 RepID=A0A0N4W0Q4_HAEPC|nr:unnamed protein product [Haemonchus placei]